MYNIDILPPSSSTQLYVLDPINLVTPPIVNIQPDQEYLTLIMVTTHIPVVFIDLGRNTQNLGHTKPGSEPNINKFIQNTLPV